jgi:DNA-binding NtrC family response regulator
MRTTVLILGESGTGKELIAKAIHQLSPRSRRPLITVHCAALSPTLLESELFGHEKGAFTGAHERRIGYIEQAQGGTLFLDEIGEIDATLQIKLLRFLGERTFQRVGGNKTITADVRLVAATNRDLKKMADAGTFRQDLYFRLAVVPIKLPPLRERLEDVPLLARAFLAEYCRENGKSATDFTPEALEALASYAWPGNVRELGAAVERALVFSRGDRITLRDLPPNIVNPQPVEGEAATVSAPAPSGDESSVREAEKQLIIRVLRECGGNRTLAAKKLGISRRTLHRKLHTHQLENF